MRAYKKNFTTAFKDNIIPSLGSDGAKVRGFEGLYARPDGREKVYATFYVKMKGDKAKDIADTKKLHWIQFATNYRYNKDNKEDKTGVGSTELDDVNLRLFTHMLPMGSLPTANLNMAAWLTEGFYNASRSRYAKYGSTTLDVKNRLSPWMEEGGIYTRTPISLGVLDAPYHPPDPEWTKYVQKSQLFLVYESLVVYEIDWDTTIEFTGLGKDPKITYSATGKVPTELPAYLRNVRLPVGAFDEGLNHPDEMKNPITGVKK